MGKVLILKVNNDEKKIKNTDYATIATKPPKKPLIKSQPEQNLTRDQRQRKSGTAYFGFDVGLI